MKLRTLTLFFLPLLLLLPSCGALQALSQGREMSDTRQRVDDGLTKVERVVNEGLAEIRETAEELQEKYDAAVKQADVDGDGKVEGWNEQLLLLLAGGGGLAEMLRRKLKGQDQRAQELKATAEDLNARIDHEREKRKDAEVALLKAQLETRSAPMDEIARLKAQLEALLAKQAS